jgi:leucyl-tRNA synthetase
MADLKDQKLDKYDPSEIEQGWYQYWEDHGVFHDEPDPDRRAVIDVNASREDRLVEVRYFDKKQFHLPIMQAEMDANPQLVQNDGY